MDKPSNRLPDEDLAGILVPPPEVLERILPADSALDLEAYATSHERFRHLLDRYLKADLDGQPKAKGLKRQTLRAARELERTWSQQKALSSDLVGQAVSMYYLALSLGFDRAQALETLKLLPLVP